MGKKNYAALGFPYSLLHPPTSLVSQHSGPRYRHPMERITDLYYESEMAMEKFGMTMDVWLKTVPKHVRIHQLAVYRLHLEKQAYYNTPKEERFSFFNR